MILSRERLMSESETTGFRPELLEKVMRLVSLLNAIAANPRVRDVVALKGGTALNLFYLPLPRLSVDIDLNYVGAGTRQSLLAKRAPFLEDLEQICAREHLIVQRRPSAYAGGKVALRYLSALGSEGNLDVDVNFILRTPLWHVHLMSSVPAGHISVSNFPLLDIHELIAGKLVALLDRATARDLFDAAQLAQMDDLDSAKLRLAFVVYGAASRRDWRTVDLSRLSQSGRARNHLVPLLREADTRANDAADVEALAQKAHALLSRVLPLTQAEVEFVSDINDKGLIHASLLTSDGALADIIAQHPSLAWKVQNVRRFKGLDEDAQDITVTERRLSDPGDGVISSEELESRL
jgi:predicted nucleotidyltransferase component of viral defense system